jgi:hypothetical protein
LSTGVWAIVWAPLGNGERGTASSQKPNASTTVKNVPSPSDLLNPVGFRQFGQFIICMATPSAS